MWMRKTRWVRRLIILGRAPWMAHGADCAPSAQRPAPSAGRRADLARAVGCEVCQGWGTVVTDEGRHELCRACQTGGRSAESVTHPPGPGLREE
jgi:hypothetical protein